MTATENRLAPDTMLAGKYKLVKQLGAGGMGEVWLAINTDIGRKVAIKFLHSVMATDEGLRARFRQEARVASAIEHPGICDVLDMGTTADDDLFIVMEALSGESLGERLNRIGRLPLTAIGPAIEPVLDALGAAHDAGVVHRDLKPDNLFLTNKPTFTSKILDFGISKLAGDGESVSLTQSGAVMGTPFYMSPEQARGARDVGPATDLYAMGAILHQVVAGSPPFPGTSYNEVLAKVLTEPAPSLTELRPQVPPALSALVAQLLSKDVDERPKTAGDVLVALRAALEDVVGEDETAATIAPGASGEGLATAPTGMNVADAGTDRTAAPATTPDADVADTAAPVAPATTPDVPEAVEQRERPGWVFPAVGLVAVAGGVGLWVALAGGGAGDNKRAASEPVDAAPLVTTTDATTPPPRKNVELAPITLVANAPGATFFIDGDMKKPCNSPCNYSGVRGTTHNILVRAAGYDEVSMPVVLERNGGTKTFTMQRRSSAKTPRRPPDTNKRPPKRRPADAGARARPSAADARAKGLTIDEKPPF